MATALGQNVPTVLMRMKQWLHDKGLYAYCYYVSVSWKACLCLSGNPMCAKSSKVSLWRIPLRTFHNDRYEIKYLRLSSRYCSQFRVRNYVEILKFYMRIERSSGKAELEETINQISLDNLTDGQDSKAI